MHENVPCMTRTLEFPYKFYNAKNAKKWLPLFSICRPYRFLCEPSRYRIPVLSCGRRDTLCIIWMQGRKLHESFQGFFFQTEAAGITPVLSIVVRLEVPRLHVRQRWPAQQVRNVWWPAEGCRGWGEDCALWKVVGSRVTQLRSDIVHSWIF